MQQCSLKSALHFDMDTHLNIQYRTVTATIVGVIVANSAILFRLVARRVGRLGLTTDDFLIIIALVSHPGNLRAL